MDVKSRSPQGERGLKSQLWVGIGHTGRRSPQGERGLKSPAVATVEGRRMSLPARGAWIEIPRLGPPGHPGPVAPRKGSVD